MVSNQDVESDTFLWPSIISTRFHDSKFPLDLFQTVNIIVGVTWSSISCSLDSTELPTLRLKSIFSLNYYVTHHLRHSNKIISCMHIHIAICRVLTLLSTCAFDFKYAHVTTHKINERDQGSTSQYVAVI